MSTGSVAKIVFVVFCVLLVAGLVAACGAAPVPETDEPAATEPVSSEGVIVESPTETLEPDPPDIEEVPTVEISGNQYRPIVFSPGLSWCDPLEDLGNYAYDLTDATSVVDGVVIITGLPRDINEIIDIVSIRGEFVQLRQTIPHPEALDNVRIVSRLYEYPMGVDEFLTVWDVIYEISLVAIARGKDLATEPDLVIAGIGGSPYHPEGSSDGGVWVGSPATEDDFLNQWALTGDHGIRYGGETSIETGILGIFDTSPFPAAGDYQIDFLSPILDDLNICVSHPTGLSPLAGIGEVGDHGLFAAGLSHVVSPINNVHLYRVLGANGSGDIFTLAEALNAFLAIDAPHKTINLSLGIKAHMFDPTPGYLNLFNFWATKDETALCQILYDLQTRVSGDYGIDLPPVLDVEVISDGIIGEGGVCTFADDAEKEAAKVYVLDLLPEFFVPTRTPLEVVGESLKEADAKKVIVVAAAGNDGLYDSEISDFPATQVGVIGVGATMPDGSIASYSNFGDLYAPGGPGANCQAAICDEGLISLITFTTEDELLYGFGYWSGTSFAAPLVSGMVSGSFFGPDYASILSRLRSSHTCPATTLPDSSLQPAGIYLGACY